MQVAPYMGAWIEIFICAELIVSDFVVAPYMGAWIEIKIDDYELQRKQ